MQFTTILHPVRKGFGISCNEYCVADMIALLAANPKATVPGWCNAKRGYMAAELDLSRQSIITIIQKLVAKGLVEEDRAKNTRTTSLWYDAVRGCQETLHVKKLDSQVSRNFTPTPDEGVKKVDTECKETLQPECQETLQPGVKKVDTDNKRDNNKGDNKTDTATATASSAGATGEVDSVVDPVTLEAEQPPPTPPDSARPPASPKIEKKVYGDGDLQKMVRHYARNNPDQYEVDMYTEFLEHYTEVVINSSNPAEVGKELWRTHKTFPIKKLLETWLPGYLRDKQKAQQQHESATRSTTNPGAGQGRSSRPKNGYSRPVKRTPIITPDMLRRDGQTDRNARPDGDLRTIVLDVDPGREPDPAGTDR